VHCQLPTSTMPRPLLPLTTRALGSAARQRGSPPQSASARTSTTFSSPILYLSSFVWM
jgi:hypothetical protein